jgi:uncharacterized LabA/DUF88 family protein
MPQGLGRGYFFLGRVIRACAHDKRATAFVDGQNLFHAAREAFGYHHPNYDVSALARALCARMRWHLTGVRFYTGIPDAADRPFWSRFWAGKLGVMGRQGVDIYARPLKRRTRTLRLPDGSMHAFVELEEKGIDVRIALDVVRMAYRREYDVALILSQDQDLSEAATEVAVIAREQSRWIKTASAFPGSTVAHKNRGIDGTDWIRIDRATYDACLDRRDYRHRS